MNGVLIVVHGSREKEAQKSLDSIVEIVKDKLREVTIEVAYIGYGEPSIDKGLASMVERGITNIKVIPYFLFEGIHVKETIPNEISAFIKKHRNVTITMGETLGADKRLADILVNKIID